MIAQRISYTEKPNYPNTYTNRSIVLLGCLLFDQLHCTVYIRQTHTHTSVSIESPEWYDQFKVHIKANFKYGN